MSIEPVAPGELVALVTYLEMRAPPEEAALADGPYPLALRHIERPSTDDYRALFRLVGARWLWFSRLAMDDKALGAIVGDPRIEVYAVEDESGTQVGMLELDRRQEGQCELAFVGLVPALAGQGHGRWFLDEAVRLAWRPGTDLVHVHTCSLDHPAALPAYLRAGFVPVGRGIERFADPRLIGILPRDCAPQVPLLGTDTAA